MGSPSCEQRYLVLVPLDHKVWSGLGKQQMSPRIKRRESKGVLKQQQNPDQSVSKYIWHRSSEATLLFILMGVLECQFCLFFPLIPTGKYIVRAFLIREIEVSKRRVFPCQDIVPHLGDGCFFGKSLKF